jgi:hydroxymethylpyrimidine kinase/phosphomethylpyrimidine kinase
MIRPVTLTVAGSDSGGGAGIQADVRTMSCLGTFATTVVTAITAQNLTGVSDVAPVPLASVARQLDAVTHGFAVRAAKTGMLWSAEVVELVASVRRDANVRDWVIDPVMVATSGARLLAAEAVRAYCAELIPGATLVTPNLDEAAVLLGVARIDAREQIDAARALAKKLDCNVLLKGGHLDGEPVDVLCEGDDVHRWTHPREHDVNTHGTGCILAAAITALLAHGQSLREACAGGLGFVAQALTRPHTISCGARLAGIEHAQPEAQAVRFMGALTGNQERNLT